MIANNEPSRDPRGHPAFISLSDVDNGVEDEAVNGVDEVRSRGDGGLLTSITRTLFLS